MISKYLAAVAATALVAAPVAAAPAASNLSVAKSVRTGSASAKKNEAAGGGLIVALLAVAAVGVGIYVAVDKNDDTPDSN